MKRLLGIFVILLSFSVINGQWSKKPFPSTANLIDVEFADQKNGWIIGYKDTEGIIFKTSDGGENWVKTFYDNFTPQKLQVINKTNLFFNDTNGNLYTSKDGGITWNKYKAAYGKFFYSFINESTGWSTSFLNNTFSIKKTIDGGANWITIKEAYQDNYLKEVSDIFFFDNNTGWVCGVQFVYKTDDGGSTWKFFDLKGWVNASAISFMNKQLGWITCKWHTNDIPNIIETQDGGNTWNNCNIDATNFETGESGWWFPLSKFSRVESLDSNNVYISGLSKSGYGQILKATYPKVYFTTWKNQQTSDIKPWFINKELNDIEIIDSDNILVVGEAGTFLKKNTAKSLTIVSPNGKEKIFPKNIVPIEWKAENLINEKIDIYASSNSGIEWSLIAENINISQGVFNWRVFLPPTNNALIKIVQKSNNLFDSSDSPFSVIEDPRKLKLEYPVFGDTITKNTDIRLKWSLNYNSPGPIKILFTFKNNGSFSSFDSLTANIIEGTCIWHSNDFNQYIDITIQDLSNPEIIDFASNIFVTYPPSIKIVAPGKGFKWQVDSLKQIKVEGLYLKNFSLFLSVDNGNNWEPLGLPFYTPEYYSPNTISLKVPNKVSDKCKIKAVANKDPHHYHITDSTFSITNAKNLGYFPLKTGNRWYYKYITSFGFNGVYKMLIVTKDSLIKNKLMYQLDEYTSDNKQFVLTQRAFRFYSQEGNSILEYPNTYPDNRPGEIFNLSYYAKNINLFNKGFELYEWSGGSTPNFFYRSFINNIGIKTYSSQGRPYWNDLIQLELVGCIIDGQAYGETFEGYQVGITGNTGLPTAFSLSQNYPNPFNPETTISYAIPNSEHVTLKVYDVLGREVATLVNENKNAGTYNSKLNTQNYKLPSGVYFYRLTAGSNSETKKLILMK